MHDILWALGHKTGPGLPQTVLAFTKHSPLAWALFCPEIKVTYLFYILRPFFAPKKIIEMQRCIVAGAAVASDGGRSSGKQDQKKAA